MAGSFVLKLICASIAFLAMSLLALPMAMASELATDTVPTEMLESVAQVRAAKPTETKSDLLAQLAAQSSAQPATPIKTVYVSENQPVHILDGEGRLVQILYLKKNPGR